MSKNDSITNIALFHFNCIIYGNSFLFIGLITVKRIDRLEFTYVFTRVKSTKKIIASTPRHPFSHNLAYSPRQKHTEHTTFSGINVVDFPPTPKIQVILKENDNIIGKTK